VEGSLGNKTARYCAAHKSAQCGVRMRARPSPPVHLQDACQNVVLILAVGEE